MKLEKQAGATSEIWQVFVRDSSSTTGAGLTGLAFNTASLTAYYHRDTDTTATAISLVTMTVGTFTSSGFKEIDATNMPGWYQFCPPNAALASGAKSVAIHLKGATNMAPLPIEVQLVGYNPESSTVLLASGTGAGQIVLSSGQVTAATVNDKTGYSLTQTFPTNFSALGISAGGHISNVDTLTTYTGNTVQTGDSYARIGVAGVGLTNLGDTRIANLDTTVSSRLASSSYTAPDNTSIATILSDVNVGAGAIYSRIGAPAGASIAADIATVNAKTANLPASPAATGDAMTLTSAYDAAKTAAQAGNAMTLTSGERNAVADAMLDRDMSTGTDNGSTTVRTVRQALRFLRNKWAVVAGVVTVYKEDDSTASWTASLSTDAAAVPVIGSDPAGP